MNPIVVLLVNGDAFFIGMGMAIIGLLTRAWMRSRAALTIMRIIGVIGAFLVVASSTPFPIWVYCLWMFLWLLGFLPPFVRVTKIIILCVTLLSILLCALEFPYHLRPTISLFANQHVYVIGDSLSAGLDSSTTNWPVVLGSLSRLEVTNLAQAGATASSALVQTKGIVIQPSVVIVEIGGNDMLGDTPSGQFHSDLDVLLQRVSQGN